MKQLQQIASEKKQINDQNWCAHKTNQTDPPLSPVKGNVTEDDGGDAHGSSNGYAVGCRKIA